MSEMHECLRIYTLSGAGCWCAPVTYEELDEHFKYHKDYKGDPFIRVDGRIEEMR